MIGTSQHAKETVVVGGGPAGLTAAYLLAKEGIPVTVLEADERYVGGIARTASYKNFRFDIGGHRFFSKSREVEALWDELLPNDMLDRPRSSQIYYRRQFFSYPLKPIQALRRLGVLESTRCMASYAAARLRPIANPANFEEWVTNQFGSRLFSIFFKTYTEKVWGMPCREISADWAAQRIRQLSLGKAVWNALTKSKGRDNEVVTTLIDSFRYPRLGPGMIWEACTERIREMGGQVLLGHRAHAFHWDEDTQTWTVQCTTPDAGQAEFRGHHVISSAPLAEVIPALHPAPATETVQAAQSLRYRDFLVVTLIVRDSPRFSDQWIYIHDPDVSVGRIQNFRAWSPEMVPDDGTNCYGLEYFCFAGDGMWQSSDEELLQLGTRELEQLGLGAAEDVLDGCVVRQPKAYPVYDADYARHVGTLRRELAQRFPNFHPVGRNGMHKYNNQDHAMMTAMLTVRNIVEGTQQFNVWAVNQDAEYLESQGKLDHQDADPAGRQIPRPVGQR